MPSLTAKLASQLSIRQIMKSVFIISKLYYQYSSKDNLPMKMVVLSLLGD